MTHGMTPTNLQPGQIVAGRYEIRDVVGRGGMGCIYRVYDKVLDEEVALKTLLPELVEDKMILDRFFNEARITRSLSHPNIVRVHDIGQDKGIIYISMEFLKGRSLRQLLDRLKPGQRLPINGILRMFDAICAALDYAHNYTVHRDIKPENVMVLPDGAVKIMDFGISKLKANPNLTSASVVMGTPHYMSPEQLRNTSAVDQRADVYSLGVMLYEMLTGDKPTGLAKPVSQVRGEVPGSLDPIIEKCCQPDPNKRFQTVGELREALREIRVALEGGTDPDARIVDVKPPRTFPVRRTVVGLVMAGVIVATGYGIVRAEGNRRAVLEAAAAQPDLPAPLGGDSVEGEGYVFDRLLERMDALRADATAFLEEAGSAENAYRSEWVTRGDALLEVARAQRETEPRFALTLAWDAAACYLAPVYLPEDMVFVPPMDAEARGRIAPYFLDKRPVLQADFDAFCGESDWPCPEPSYFAPDMPMDRVTYYDALAYLAAQSPAERLPTRAEWERGFRLFAAEDRVWDLHAGPETDRPEDDAAEEEDDDGPSVPPSLLRFPATPHAEWTSTAANRTVDDFAAITFGDRVYVCSGYWSGEAFIVGDATRQLYSRAGAGVGFRGVRPLPRTLAGLDALK